VLKSIRRKGAIVTGKGDLMLRIAIGTVVFLALFPPRFHAQPAPDSAPRQVEALAFLIGDWTIEGRESTFSESCAWFANRAHVVCQSRTSKSSGVSVFSHASEKQHLVYYHYGSSGAAVAMDVFTDGRALIGTREVLLNGNLVREQVWMTPRDADHFVFREQTSKNGGPWQTTTEFVYARRK
jgi:hypothetical protein